MSFKDDFADKKSNFEDLRRKIFPEQYMDERNDFNEQLKDTAPQFENGRGDFSEKENGGVFPRMESEEESGRSYEPTPQGREESGRSYAPDYNEVFPDIKIDTNPSQNSQNSVEEPLVSEAEREELFRSVEETIFSSEEEHDEPQVQSPQEAFEDSINPYKYIELDSNALAFDRVHRVLNERLKMSLIYGVPGSGKSMFLSRLHSDLISMNRISILISSPILNEAQLFQVISYEIFRYSNFDEVIPKSFEELLERITYYDEFPETKTPILLLDEAQLYSNSILEKIRVLSDTQKIRVIFAVHQLKEEDIFSQEHFRSRIWEKIELKNASISELKVYIQKKLMGVSMLSLAKQFSNRVVRRIHKITDGNYRATNNLLYAYFSKYPELYKQSSLIHSSTLMGVRIREIEIVAIQIGFIPVKVSDKTDLRHMPTAENVWRGWKRKEYLKYASILLLPTAIFMVYKLYLYQFGEDINSIQKEVIVAKEAPFQELLPEREIPETIIEPQNIDPETDDDVFVENKTLEEKSPLENREEEVASNSLEVQNQFLQREKPEELSDIEEQPLQVVEEDFSFVKELISKEKSQNGKEQNIKISEIEFNKIPFKQGLKFTPSVVYLGDERVSKILDLKERDESSYIIELKNSYFRNKSINALLKILDFYKIEKNYTEIYNFSLELNKLDVNYKDPYINIANILKDEKMFKDAEAILAGCRSCR
jgi:4-hydroxy-tetrahydrodipicolinate synthase